MTAPARLSGLPDARPASPVLPPLFRLACVVVQGELRRPERRLWPDVVPLARFVAGWGRRQQDAAVALQRLDQRYGRHLELATPRLTSVMCFRPVPALDGLPRSHERGPGDFAQTERRRSQRGSQAR